MNKRPESRWVLKTQNDETVEAFADFLEEYFASISKKPSKSSAEEKKEYFVLMSRLFYNRGFREISQIDNFFNTSPSSFYDPFLLPDMDKAVERINKAISDNEKITVYYKENEYKPLDAIKEMIRLYANILRPENKK